VIWLARARQFVLLRAIGADARQRPLQDREVDEVRGRHADFVENRPAKPFVDQHEPFGFHVSERTQQNGIDETEYRAVRADAERQRDDRNGGEHRRLHQGTDGVPHVGLQ
jgi:hypothetical protein